MLEKCAQYEKALSDAQEKIDVETANAVKTRSLQEKLAQLEDVLVYNSDLRAAVEHLRVDNARLVSILASTGEYQEFLQYLEDSKGICYIPPESAVVTSARYTFTGSGGGAVTRSSTSPKKSASAMPHGYMSKEVEQRKAKFANAKKRDDWHAFQNFEDTYASILHGDRDALDDWEEHENWMPRDAFYVAGGFGMRMRPICRTNFFIVSSQDECRGNGARRSARKVKEKYKESG